MVSVKNIIANNIDKYGYHVYDVLGGPLPPWSYSIGLREKFGFELVFAGGLYFSANERREIFGRCVDSRISAQSYEILDEKGIFSIRPVLNDWPEIMFAGAIQYFGERPLFMQLYPDANSWTLDVPDMSESWSVERFPAWKWLVEPWQFPVSPKSHVLTDTDILGGIAPAEVACRFSHDYWEIFSRQPEEIPDLYRRIVPLGTLLGIEDSLTFVVNLDVGHAVERNSDLDKWVPWSGKVIT
jgi:hypothetical protein